jgi:hypothetical protein
MKRCPIFFSPLLIKFHKECNILYTVWKRTMHIQNNDTPVTHIHTHVHAHIHTHHCHVHTHIHTNVHAHIHTHTYMHAANI